MNEAWSLCRHSERFQREQLLRLLGGHQPPERRMSRDVFTGTVVGMDIEC